MIQLQKKNPPLTARPLNPTTRTSKAIQRLLVTLGIVVVVSTLVLAVTAKAEMRKTLTPRISIGEEYDDNIDLEPENEDSDWITVVSPGISLDLQTPATTMTLDYEAGFSFYRDNSSRDSTRHRGNVSWEQRLTRHLTLKVTDTLIRSEDPIVETEGVIEDVLRERRIYYRNTGQTSLSYRFGQQDQVAAGYRNRYFDDTSSRNQDSVGHEGFVNLDKWFGPSFGIGVTSLYNQSSFEQEDDFDQYGTGITVKYRWQPARTAYCRYDFLDHDFQASASVSERNDFQVHQGALGVILPLGSHTDLNFEGGYFLQDFDNRDQTEGLSFAGSLITRAQRTTLRVATSGGFDQDYYSSENLGSSEFRQVSGSADHFLTEDVRAFGSASYRWVEFFGGDALRDRKDEVWRATAGVSFSFWRRLTLFLEGSHSERSSDQASYEFEDNRVILRLTGAYPVRF